MKPLSAIILSMLSSTIYYFCVFFQGMKYDFNFTCFPISSTFYLGNSVATANFNVDSLEQRFEDRKDFLKDYHTIMINFDNGEANESNSGFFMERMVAFAKKINKKIHLVYYPPYHSKYNLIERFWAILEKYWSGCILDSVENTLKIAQKVKYKAKAIST